MAHWPLVVQEMLWSFRQNRHRALEVQLTSGSVVQVPAQSAPLAHGAPAWAPCRRPRNPGAASRRFRELSVDADAGGSESRPPSDCLPSVTVEWRCQSSSTCVPASWRRKQPTGRRARQQARRIVVLAMQPVMITHEGVEPVAVEFHSAGVGLGAGAVRAVGVGRAEDSVVRPADADRRRLEPEDAGRLRDGGETAAGVEVEVDRDRLGTRRSLDGDPASDRP